MVQGKKYIRAKGKWMDTGVTAQEVREIREGKILLAT